MTDRIFTGEPTMVAKVIDRYTLVLNQGELHGIRPGQRFLVYTIGENILDPKTKAVLGQLEIIRGTGKATHVQPSLTTIRSDMKEPPTRTIRRIKRDNPFAGLIEVVGQETVEESLPAQALPFEDPKVGDIAKPI